MSWSLIAHRADSSLNSILTTTAIDTSGANLILIGISQFNGVAAATISDSKSNTWTGLTAKSTTSLTYARIYYCVNPTVGSGHTFSADNGDVIAGTLMIQAWSGANATPFDVENGSTNTSSNSAATGSVTPSQNDSLIASVLSAGDSTSGYSIDSSLTISDSVNHTPGVTEGAAFAYYNQPTAGAINPTWSWTGAQQNSEVIAAFKPAAGGGGRTAMYVPGPHGPMVI